MTAVRSARIPEKVGVIIGSGIGGLGSLEEQHKKALEKGFDRLSPFFILQMIIDMAPGLVTTKYGCKGPNWSPVSACSTSAHAIGESVKSIRIGETDAMIAGGAEAAITPLGIAGFAAMKALSTRNDDPAHASRPLDKDRDGFVQGEGAGIVVLEELEHARRRGANIPAEIAGYGANSDAHHVTAPAPGGEGAARCMRLALADAGMRPEDIARIQAPALGKVILMDVQQAGSLRQVFRTSRNQRPFSVTVDEFASFADMSIVDSLNKLRDANLEYTLAHQSLADLELVSREFAMSVWDNTRTKDILNQDNPELCERIGRSIGTHQVRELTVRRKEGPLLTSLATGDASSRLVEAYRLHPNAIKALARCGQGYSLSDEGLAPVAYPMMPAISADYPLARKNQKAAQGLRLYETFVAG